jgi:hypothetical protein
MVVLVYLGLAVVCAGLFLATTDRREDLRRLVLGPQAGPAGPGAVPEYRDLSATPREFDLWCGYRKELAALDGEAGRKFGADPRTSWQVGQSVAIEKDTKLFPNTPDAYKSEAELEQAASQSRRLRPGDRVRVLAVTRDKGGRLWYKVEAAGKGTGYIGEHFLFWYDTPDRRRALSEERAAFVRAGEERLKKELFEARGIEFAGLAAKAASKKWTEQCGGPVGVDLGK